MKTKDYGIVCRRTANVAMVQHLETHFVVYFWLHFQVGCHFNQREGVLLIPFQRSVKTFMQIILNVKGIAVKSCVPRRKIIELDVKDLQK